MTSLTVESLKREFAPAWCESNNNNKKNRLYGTNIMNGDPRWKVGYLYVLFNPEYAHQAIVMSNHDKIMVLDGANENSPVSAKIFTKAEFSEYLDGIMNEDKQAFNTVFTHTYVGDEFQLSKLWLSPLK